MSVVKIKDLGTFTYNYKIDPYKKYNVISAVLFKSAKVRDFSLYTKNLSNFAKIKHVIDKSFVFRLYYDNSIIDDEYVKKIFSFLNTNYQLVHYDCPAFKDDDGLHNGTFGTLIRFLPFHDFPENDVDNCFVCDVDDIHGKFSQEKTLNEYLNVLNKYHLKLVFSTWACLDSLHNLDKNNFIRANFLIIQKIPINCLLYFINTEINILFEKYDRLKENMTKQTLRKYKHKFFYGIDEVYLELFVKPYFDKYKLKFGRIISIFELWFYNKLLRIFAVKNNDLQLKFKKIVLSINKKFGTNYNNLNDFIGIFKKIDWKRNTNMHKQYEYFHKKVLKLYIKYPDLERVNEYACFKEINTIIDDTNKIEIIN